jgi:xanthine dehydrogenase YagT iron-sulfur-binding subunit
LEVKAVHTEVQNTQDQETQRTFLLSRNDQSPFQEQVAVNLSINGEACSLVLEPQVTLLDTLRERLNLTGTKKGCNHGQCGACTVLVNGRRVNACLTLIVMLEGDAVTTIEGVAQSEKLHPLQEAFIAHDALQCGSCTPGQIMSALALINEGHACSDDEIREWMSGNLCRCGAYANIVAAIRARGNDHATL